MDIVRVARITTVVAKSRDRALDSAMLLMSIMVVLILRNVAGGVGRDIERSS